MPIQPRFNEGAAVLYEIQEFAGFSKAVQRYIRQSLDIGLARADAVSLWARSAEERNKLRRQYAAYADLDRVRRSLAAGPAPAPETFMGVLVAMSAFDLTNGPIAEFGAYRFLYERLLGSGARPFLPAAYCAAAALPHIAPDRRVALLASVAEAVAAPGWSARQPVFLPEWVEKIDAALA